MPDKLIKRLNALSSSTDEGRKRKLAGFLADLWHIEACCSCLDKTICYAFLVPPRPIFFGFIPVTISPFERI